MAEQVASADPAEYYFACYCPVCLEKTRCIAAQLQPARILSVLKGGIDDDYRQRQIVYFREYGLRWIEQGLVANECRL